MTTRHVSFPVLLDHLAGREDPAVASHVASCTACAALATAGRRLLAAGRSALAAPRPTRRALRRAQQIFKEAQAKPRGTWLTLVLDSLARPAPALRQKGKGPVRFLRFEGDVTVELSVTPGARGLDVRGQILPADFAAEVVLDGKRRASVDAEGTFVLRGVPRRRVELRIGPARFHLDP